MNLSEIKRILEENGFNDIEVISEDNELAVVRFYFDFEEDEIKAAKKFSEEENAELGMASYLNDLAVDYVGEVIEEMAEELEVNAQFISYEPFVEEGYNEFVGIFSIKDKKVDVDEILEKLEL
ncbi:MAG: hypothetical protein AB6733_11965 [Clostridiaceae bacterium]